MTESARRKLEALVEELKVFGEDAPWSVWGEDGLALLDERFASGWLTFERAVRMARRALVTDDDELIAAAVVKCMEMKIDGLKMQHNYKISVRRRRGGKTSGENRTESAQNLYGPFVRLYLQKVKEGRTPGGALKAMKAAMADAPLAVPSDRTLRNWISKLSPKIKLEGN